MTSTVSDDGAAAAWCPQQLGACPAVTAPTHVLHRLQMQSECLADSIASAPRFCLQSRGELGLASEEPLRRMCGELALTCPPPAEEQHSWGLLQRPGLALNSRGS